MGAENPYRKGTFLREVTLPPETRPPPLGVQKSVKMGSVTHHLVRVYHYILCLAINQVCEGLKSANIIPKICKNGIVITSLPNTIHHLVMKTRCKSYEYYYM